MLMILPNRHWRRRRYVFVCFKCFCKFVITWSLGIYAHFQNGQTNLDQATTLEKEVDEVQVQLDARQSMQDDLEASMTAKTDDVSYSKNDLFHSNR